MVPAAIRTKNPGAMWGRVGRKPDTFFPTPAGPNGCATNAPIPLRWGSKQTIYLSDGLGQNNNIALFDSWVQGIGAQIDLWRTSPNYRNKRFADAIAIWAGGNNVPSYLKLVQQEVPGMSGDTIMNDAFWRSPMAIPFLKAQAHHEAGQPMPATDADYAEAQRRVFAGETRKKVTSTAAVIVPTAATVAATHAAGWSGIEIGLSAFIAAGAITAIVLLVRKMRS